MHKKNRRMMQKGSILVFSLVILTLILVTAMGMAASTLSQRRATSLSGKSTAAFQNADKGVEVFLQAIYRESSPLDTLDDIVQPTLRGEPNRLAAYKCEAGRLILQGAGTGEFEIVPYTDVDPSAAVSIAEVTDCTTQLGDIIQFKIIGEHAGAARALQLRVSDSITRNMIGHWSFEDNAEGIRWAGGLAGAGSPVAKDGSRHGHTLTLCPIDNNLASTEFDLCPKISLSTSVDPPVGDPATVWMDHAAQWDAGIVDETSAAGLPHTESLRFNGTSHFLAINNQNDVPSNGNYVDDADNYLQTEDALAISVWIKANNTDQGAIVRHGTLSSGSGHRGYALFLSGTDTLTFQVMGHSGGVGGISVPYDDGDWHHVVAMWDKEDVKVPEIYIDGKKQTAISGTESSRPQKMSFDASAYPFMIGGTYTGTDDSLFTVADYGTQDGVQTGFDGWLDDLRIYERALTQREVLELCNLAKTSWVTADASRCQP